MPADPSQANLIAYWRATELFAPQPIPKPEDKTRITRLDPSAPLPWQPTHPIRAEWLGDKQAWQHVVYCGVYSLDQAFGNLRAQYPAQEELPDEHPQAGESAIAAFVVADDGRPIMASAVMASCAWALSTAAREGIAAVGTASFEQAMAAFRGDFEELVEAEADDERANELARSGHQVGAPIEANGLHACRSQLATLLKLDDLPEGAALRNSAQIRIVSRKVSAREAYEAGEREFLNSFYAEDLRKVGKAIEQNGPGKALREYMTPAHKIDTAERIDVERDLAYVRRATASKNIPEGRWPSASEQVPGLGQQLAINTITRPNKNHLFAVNGPPGTGKTVMLRDLVAAIVVRRADRLADLKDPREAFDTPIGWTGTNRKVHPLTSNLGGHELVLACATNAAAENVSAEIPAIEAIDEQWHKQTDYFTETATRLLNPKDCDTPREAWAMIAAVLGSRHRNKTFVSRFWFEGMNEALKKAAPAGQWKEARNAFREQRAKLAEIEAERAKYSDLFEHLERAEAEEDRARKDMDTTQALLPEAEARLRESEEAVELARNAVKREERQRSEHRQRKPGLWEWLRTRGRAGREWRMGDRRIAGAIAAATDAAAEAGAGEKEHASEAAKLSEETERYRSEWQAAQAQSAELTSAIGRAREQWGQAHPGTVFPDDEWERPEQRERREREAPWIDAEYNEARTELFIAALALHRAFVEGAAKQMKESLRAATELISGQAGEVTPKAAKAAWQALFMAIPLVSTTFASFPYLFRHLGKEAIGWLLIDEAGQATPQAAVGPLWRSKKAVVVGDPLQLEPIVQLPKSAEEILRREHGIGTTYLQENPSVQTQADQIARAGTYRGDGEDRIWVGTPLNVHRRCEEPMFSIVNIVAYENQMINCTPKREPFPHQESHWIDVPSRSIGSNGVGTPNASAGGNGIGTPHGVAKGNWIPEEGEALKQLLEGLRYQMVDFKQVFLITPFRNVASQIRKHAKTYQGITAGTIHTAQGREADIVILILGGNQNHPRARAWAAEKPNLLNVAVSRARRRLYVIGDREAWSNLPHFETLAAALPLAEDHRGAASSSF